ncbi:MAG: phosphate acyltransferase PlsX [Chloroflexi bacterium]|nr:phosphate acyltransferase PlsX [Chloroflexota bacterium]
MRIVLDASGGDHAPQATVAGAIAAARAWGDQIILVGDEASIRAELAKHDTSNLDLPVVDAPEMIEMTEHPAQAIRRKRNSSVAIGLRLVRDGEADAFVSAGHSGATMAGALFILGRIRGIERPCLVTHFPTVHGHALLLDSGATTDCKPEYLVQFAQMGNVYAQKIANIAMPRIGLLANGEEANKGDKLVQDTHGLLQQRSDLTFIGNIEPKDMLINGSADVVVADGFVGNLVLKFGEGVFKMITTAASNNIKAEWRKNLVLGLLPALVALILPGKGRWRALIAGLTGLTLPASMAVAPLLALRKRMDYRSHGGAPLLGVNGIAIVAHGKSDALAIQNAIGQARNAVEQRVVATISHALETVELVPSA